MKLQIVLLIFYPMILFSQSTFESIYYQNIVLRTYNRDHRIKFNGTLKPSLKKFPNILYLKSDTTFVEISPKLYRRDIKYEIDSGKWYISSDTINFNYLPKRKVILKSKITNDQLFLVFYNTNGEVLLSNYPVNIYYNNNHYKTTTNYIGEVNMNISSFDSIYIYDKQLTDFPLKIYNTDKSANYFEIYIYKKGSRYFYDNKYIYCDGSEGKEKQYKRKKVKGKYLKFYNKVL